MKCPACSKDLVQISASGVEVDLCKNGCGGIWFDRTEIQKFDENNELVPSDFLLKERPTTVELNPFPRQCPRCCGDHLVRQNYDSSNPIEIDLCWHCGGMWLDVHELAEIREGGGDREAAGNAFVRASLNLAEMVKAKRGEYAELPKVGVMIRGLKSAYFGG